ncbi:hypothetical protein D3C87_2179210 [compost metagenome]
MGGDAALAAGRHRDGQCDQLARACVERTVAILIGVQRHEAFHQLRRGLCEYCACGTVLLELLDPVLDH